MEFLSKQLGIEHPEEIEFQRIHRIGRKRDRPRMIIEHFLRYPDRERVTRKAFKLKGTDFKSFDDLPKELINLRKKHMSTTYHEAKIKKQERKWLLVNSSRINYTSMVSLLFRYV